MECRKTEYWYRYYFWCMQTIPLILRTCSFQQCSQTKEFIKFNEWLSANKLSLNVGKTRFSLFRKPGKKYSIPSLLSTLKTNSHNIERVNTMKFPGVLLDDNLSRKEHIKYLENKITKNIVLMYRAKPFLDKESLLALYSSYIR